jgi:hypothetical protein
MEENNSVEDNEREPLPGIKKNKRKNTELKSNLGAKLKKAATWRKTGGAT